MKALEKDQIQLLLDSMNIGTRTTTYKSSISTASEIHGIQKGRELSGIIDDAIRSVLQSSEIPREATIVAVGANGREDPTWRSDIDLICYMPDASSIHAIVDIYRRNLYRLHVLMGWEGAPVMMVPGEFTKNRSDLFQFASMNLDARLISGGDVLSMEEIQTKVRSACLPITTAARHELRLQDFGLTSTDQIRNQYSVEFDVKKDPGGLRHLQHVLWFTAAIEQTNIHTLLASLEKDDPETYNALDLLLHVRAWLHLKKPRIDTHPDLLTTKLWPDLRIQFGDDIIDQIAQARERIIQFQSIRMLREKRRGMKIGDGTLYTTAGLTIDHSLWESKDTLVLQLLKNAQQTGLPISVEEVESLRKYAGKNMNSSHPDWIQLMREPGKFSDTLLVLQRLGIVNYLFPDFSRLQTASYEEESPYADMTRLGRTLARIRKFEQLIEKDLKNVFDMLDDDQLIALRIALSCEDIPETMGISVDEYCDRLSLLHPTLCASIELARQVLKRRNILFDCAMYDCTSDIGEIHRITGEIGDMGVLNMVLLFTCACREYGNSRMHSKYQWDITFNLFHDVSRILEGDTNGARDPMGDIEHRLSPEQWEIYQSASSGFSNSRYIPSNMGDLAKTMRYLHKASEEKSPQVTIEPRGCEGSYEQLRIIVSASWTDELPVRVAYACFRNQISIDDAEIHTFGSPPVLGAIFLDGQRSIGRSDEMHEMISPRILADSVKEILREQANPIENLDWILEKSGPRYSIDKTRENGNYKLIVHAGKNMPGFLAALWQTITKARVQIISATVNTIPTNNPRKPRIIDSIIIAPDHLEDLKKILKIN